MDKADHLRVVNKEKIVIDEEQIKQRETLRMQQRNPQKKPLDESDVKIIQNYIDCAREKYENQL